MNRPCATTGCTPPQEMPGMECYDHLGEIRRFCNVHGNELIGVQKRIGALLEQIEGLERVHTCGVRHTHGMLPDATMASCLPCDLERTVCEQGALLVKLIRRERELTGASEVGDVFQVQANEHIVALGELTKASWLR